MLPHLGFVEGCCDARQSCLNLLPYVGPGWCPKVSLAAMLDLGVCRWDHIVLGISARSHVDAATLRRVLERMEAAWPEGEERMAKLSVNAMIGLWARSTEVVYSVRSSSSELDGAGADFSQAFAYEGGMVWDFVYARRLLSNARRILDAPPRYLAQVKTDCLLTQRLPKRFTERLLALEALRHPDGTPVYRVEETRPLLGSSRAPRMEAERPKQRRWNGVDDPISHCLAGNSLLLTGLPGTGKTHLAADELAVLQRRADGPPGPGVQHGRQLPEVSQQQELHVGVQPHAGKVRPERHVQLRDLLHHQPVQLLRAAPAHVPAHPVVGRLRPQARPSKGTSLGLLTGSHPTASLAWPCKCRDSQSRCPSRPPCPDDGGLDGCDGSAAGDVLTSHVHQIGAGEQLLAQAVFCFKPA